MNEQNVYHAQLGGAMQRHTTPERVASALDQCKCCWRELTLPNNVRPGWCTLEDADYVTSNVVKAFMARRGGPLAVCLGLELRV